MKRVIGTIFLVASMFLAPGVTSAVGVAVKPERLTLDTTIGQKNNASLLVMNVTEEPALYRVYLVSHTRIITVTPSEFVLLPGEQKTVGVTIRALIPQAISTDIAIVARPLAAAAIATASGVQVPLYVIVRIAMWQIGAIAIAVSCALTAIGVRWKKKSHNRTTV